MPKLKPKTIRAQALREYIAGKTFGLNKDDAAALFGLTRQTYANRMARPDSFTVGELLTASRRGNMPIDELRAAIRE